MIAEPATDHLDPFHRGCPSRPILELIGSKWALLIVCALRDGPVRNNALLRRIDGISQKMLTQTLRDLERNGVIARISYPEVPPRVEYRLTELGESLGGLLVDIERWVLGNYARVADAQRAFDTRSADFPALAHED
jgi:DNA-binding HxlR family transcriptional regulator